MKNTQDIAQQKLSNIILFSLIGRFEVDFSPLLSRQTVPFPATFTCIDKLAHQDTSLSHTSNFINASSLSFLVYIMGMLITPYPQVFFFFFQLNEVQHVKPPGHCLVDLSNILFLFVLIGRIEIKFYSRSIQIDNALSHKVY